MTEGNQPATELRVDLAGTLAGTDPARWAATKLVAEYARRAAHATRLPVAVVAEVVAPDASPSPGGPESFRLQRPDGPDGPVRVTGTHARGVAYGLLELADRVHYAADPAGALRDVRPASHDAATPVRGVLRTFCSDVQDKPWYYDRGFWTEYLDELATNRINRLHLALGMQYNYSHDPDVRDNYFCFAYPFLVDVPGYQVRAHGVDAAERSRNLDTLRWISDETTRRGIHFQLGLWNHGYDPGDSTDVRYPISGLGAADHAEYCAAALAGILRECPSIGGVTFRLHYEGGVPEEGHEVFWKTVMSAVRSVDRPVEIDMHGKGLDQSLVDIAVDTGAPVVVSPKYWAEFQGLPYHQTTVRDLEKATQEAGSGLRAKTLHTRRFTRYGYADYLREDRNYDVMFRIWPGSQRLLLWGDPVFAAGYGRLGTIGGSLGVELCEPLSFKGRKTTGDVDARDPYVDPALRLGLSDWKKYRYTYRLWGRLLYDPAADPECWRRQLRAEFGPAADGVERALASASRILPLVTVVHGPSASNNFYWPEMYVNMPIAGGVPSSHYGFDTAPPKTFGAVTSFDPYLFEPINDYADDLLAGRRSLRYSPIETAGWLERLAEEAQQQLARATSSSADPSVPQFRRLAVDVSVQSHLGRFFAGRARAGVSYALYERTENPGYLQAAVEHYQRARDAFADIVSATEGVYQDNITFGDRVSEQGHWSTRLQEIDEDLAALRAECANRPGEATALLPDPPPRTAPPTITHDAPATFRRGAELPLTVRTAADVTVTLHYRHLNQGEEYQTQPMTARNDSRYAAIPAGYTDSPYPLVYLFVASGADGRTWLVPGLAETLDNQPYYVVTAG